MISRWCRFEGLYKALLQRPDRGPCRPRFAERQRRLHGVAQGQRHFHQHVARGQSLDNAAFEAFMKTLKPEEVYRNEHRDLREAPNLVGKFFVKVDKERRLCSALGYLPPDEFEEKRKESAAGRLAA